MAIWIKTPPDAEPVWMAADNRIRELALSIERRAGIAPDADGLRKIREWATEIVCQCDMVERVQVMRIDAINDADMGESCYLPCDIGERIFLTRAEAEAKLKSDLN